MFKSIKNEISEYFVVFLGLVLALSVGGLIYFFNNEPIFRIIFEVPKIIVILLSLYVISLCILEDKNKANGDFFADLSFTFYRYIKQSVSFFSISIFIFIFVIENKEIFDHYLFLETKLYELISFAAFYFTATAVAIIYLFHYKKKYPEYVFQVSNTETTHIELSTINKTGKGKILSSDIYLLSLLLLNVGLVGLTRRPTEPVYMTFTVLGIIFFFIWIQNKEDTPFSHVIKNSLYSFFWLLITIFILMNASELVTQSFRVTQDIIKSKEIYQQLNVRYEVIKNSVHMIDNNISDIKSNINNFRSDKKLIKNDLLNFQSDYYELKNIYKSVFSIGNPTKILYSNDEQFDKTCEKLLVQTKKTYKTLIKLKNDTEHFTKQIKKTSNKVNTNSEKITQDINNIEKSLHRIKWALDVKILKKELGLVNTTTSNFEVN